MSLKESKDPGIGRQFRHQMSRMINQDGSFNVHVKGLQFTMRDMYIYLVDMKWPYFLGFLVLSYIVFNALFAFGYVSIGVDQLGLKSGGFVEDWLRCFFFSTPTFTTLGYGGISPVGVTANVLASL